MKKIIRKWGESLVVSFDKEDQRAYKIKEGDIADLTDMILIRTPVEEKVIRR